MKTKFSKKLLLQGLEVITYVIPSKIFYVNFDIKEKTTEISAVSAETSIQFSMESVTEELCSFVLSSNKLMDVIRCLQDDCVWFEPKGTKMAIYCEKETTRFEINTPVQGMSIKDNFDFVADISVPSKKLKEMLGKVIFATSRDEGILGGILFEIEKNTLNLVSTDGKRLAYYKDTIVVKDTSMVISLKTAFLLMKFLSDEGNCEFRIEGKKIYCKFGNVRLIFICLNGRFPNYKSVIPKEENIGQTAILWYNQFLSAFQRISAVNSIKMVMNFSKNKLKLLSKEQKIGDAEDEIDIEYQGEDMKVCVNPRYILEYLESEVKDKIILKFVDSCQPLVFRSEADTNYLYIVMPMKIN